MCILSTCLTTNELVVDGIVVVKDNKGEKTREVADIRMYHFRWNLLQLGCNVLG